MSIAMPAVVHRTAEVSRDAKIGDGTHVWNEAQVREGARIGRNCRLGKSVYVDKNVVIGDNCKIQNFATLYDGVSIGDDVFIGPHACFTNDLYPRAISPDWKIIPTKVMKGASIGANATILCGLRIGRYAMIGAGSVVTEDAPDHALMIGNPAKIMGFVCTCGRKLDKRFWCSHCKKKVSVKAPGSKPKK